MGEKQDRPFESTVILRLSGEIATRSEGIRHRFTRRLHQNLRDALERAGIDAEVREKWHRMDVITADQRAVEVGQRVFGVQAVGWARAYPWENIDDVVEIGTRLFSEKVAGKTFAVRTRRVGFRQHLSFTSQDLDRALGANLVEAGGKVNLDEHEVHVGVEVRRDRVLFFDDERIGPGGLPGGVEGRALAMVSGGVDSAVAGWTMMRRGVDLDFLFFNLAGPGQRRLVQAVVRKLSEHWAYGYSPKMHIVDLRPMMAEMQQKVDRLLWQTLLKRLMFRAGAYLARRMKVEGLVTGDSCGQGLSQTLANLAAITAPIQVGVFRPLVGMNKMDIIERARQIGIDEDCVRNPAVGGWNGGAPTGNAMADELDAVEALLDLKLLEELVDRRRIVKVLQMEIDRGEEVQTTEIPRGAIAIDLRGEGDYRRWHLDGAIHMSMDRAIEQAARLPKEGTYLFYCELGLKSAFLAERLREQGFDVVSFSGGVPTLRKYLKRRS